MSNEYETDVIPVVARNRKVKSVKTAFLMSKHFSINLIPLNSNNIQQFIQNRFFVSIVESSTSDEHP